LRIGKRQKRCMDLSEMGKRNGKQAEQGETF